MRTTLVLFLLAVSLFSPAFGQSEPNSLETNPVTPMVSDTVRLVEMRGPDAVFVDGVKLGSASTGELKGIDIRWGWSVVSDDGTFFLNPILFNDWQNVTLRPMPASFSVHFPLKVKEKGAMTQLGYQTFYSASEAPWVAGDRNYGTAHYYGTSLDYRRIFRSWNYFGIQGNPFVNGGLGYVYRSVALHNHEPMVHVGAGLTTWINKRMGITLSGTGNIGTIHVYRGYTSFIQANGYLTYRI
jgi:hypothetical protein